MNTRKDDIKYYMPLDRKDGPITVQYSPETASIVKNLMRESRLTFTQKHVFDTILRNGKSLPPNPSQVMSSQMRQCYMQSRHKHKARLMGIPVLEEDISTTDPFSLRRTPPVFGVPTRRRFDTIKASGDLEPAPLPKFKPTNKDAEKDRLAQKMAFGKETLTSPFAYSHQESLHNGGKQNTAGQRAKPEETLEHLKQQRVEELIDEIQDRMQFLLTIEGANKAKVKEHKPYIFNQIHEKLREMKQLSPESEKDVRECLQLNYLEQSLGPARSYEHRASKVFRI